MGFICLNQQSRYFSSINPEIKPDGSFPVLHEEGAIGSLGNDLFGYNGNPSLIEVISYLAYIFIIIMLLIRIQKS